MELAVPVEEDGAGEGIGDDDGEREAEHGSAEDPQPLAIGSEAEEHYVDAEDASDA